MAAAEEPVNVPTSTARRGADEPGEQRQQGVLVGPDLHAGGRAGGRLASRRGSPRRSASGGVPWATRYSKTSAVTSIVRAMPPTLRAVDASATAGCASCW